MVYARNAGCFRGKRGRRCRSRRIGPEYGVDDRGHPSKKQVAEKPSADGNDPMSVGSVPSMYKLYYVCSMFLARTCSWVRDTPRICRQQTLGTLRASRRWCHRY